MSSNPVVTTSRDPTLSATTAATGVAMAATMAKGSVCTPADKVEYPFTNWKYSVIRKMNPKRQKKATEMESAPPLKRGIEKTRTSSSGPSVCSSSTVKVTRRMAATEKQARVAGAAQPHCGPSMIARTSAVTPAVETMTPRVSNGGASIRGSPGM